ncbi:YbjQ family protein [Thermaerobacillus caldiproteolyticus]|uniref:YbjQ family protein n=1 Tax=Thermaerobacillus caldiproteolyticus TaxID=247480 RepID=UPI00188BEB7E|nr:YbjQ family protein [Anoxybacillus caldiproteolyticus]QPA31526.1 YbjQ family protein [Anoxybacillus caldiproteolyticus]
MIIATTDYIPGKQIKEYKGFVQGNTVQSKHIGKDIMASFKTIVGGEIKAYTEMMEEARQIAINRMIEETKQQGANAIIGVRLTTAAIMANTSEILSYDGTAVVVEEE